MSDNYRKNCYKKILDASSVYDIAIKSPMQFAPKLSSKLKTKFILSVKIYNQSFHLSYEVHIIKFLKLKTRNTLLQHQQVTMHKALL